MKNISRDIRHISIRLIVEIILIYLLIPIFYYLDIIPGHKSIPLLVVFLLLLVILIKDKSYSYKFFSFCGFTGWPRLFIRSFVIAILLVLYVCLSEPEFLLFLPRHNRLLWVMIMLFYPLWSAYPQEVIFRAFFFHRYKALFKNQFVMVLCNATIFAYMHFIFNSWVAIVLSFFAGLMFACTYLKSRSLLVVAIEHAIYGNMIYTIGLGHYFYVPDF